MYERIKKKNQIKILFSEFSSCKSLRDVTKEHLLLIEKLNDENYRLAEPRYGKCEQFATVSSGSSLRFWTACYCKRESSLLRMQMRVLSRFNLISVPHAKIVSKPAMPFVDICRIGSTARTNSVEGNDRSFKRNKKTERFQIAQVTK